MRAAFLNDRRRVNAMKHSDEGCGRSTAGQREVRSITITQRYVHPQADAVERAFVLWGKTPPEVQPENRQVGTNLGTAENLPSDRALQVVGAKGGTRTPTVLPARS